MYVSSAYERILCYPQKSLLHDIRSFNNFLFPEDLKNYHPLLEMVKEIKQEGPKARVEVKYRIVTQNGEVKWLEDRGQPLYDRHGKYLGICGVARDITDKKLINQVKGALPTSFPKNIQTRYYLKGKHKKNYLTPREAECAFYLLKGKTSKETAKILNISFRTVEDILQKIKNKLNVTYRSELFEVLINSCFLQP